MTRSGCTPRKRSAPQRNHYFTIDRINIDELTTENEIKSLLVAYIYPHKEKIIKCIVRKCLGVGRGKSLSDFDHCSPRLIELILSIVEDNNYIKKSAKILLNRFYMILDYFIKHDIYVPKKIILHMIEVCKKFDADVALTHRYLNHIDKLY